MPVPTRSNLVVLVLGATLAAALAAATAGAQSREPVSASTRPIRIGIGGGVVVPREGASVYQLERGMQLEGFALVRLPGGFPPLRLTLDYAKLKFDPATLAGSPTTPGAADAERTMLNGVASINLELLRGPVRPYLLAGVGAFSVKDVAASESYSDINFGLDGGAGVALSLGPISAFVEARLQNVYTREQGLVDTRSIRTIPVSFGVVF